MEWASGRQKESRMLQKEKNSSETSHKVMVEFDETKSLFLKRSIKLKKRLKLPITGMKERKPDIKQRKREYYKQLYAHKFDNLGKSYSRRNISPELFISIKN